MINLIKLIENETIKMLFKKKLFLILVILLIEIIAFDYGQYNTYQNELKNYTKSESKNYDWRPLINQQIDDLQSKLSSKDLDTASRKNLSIQLDQYKYYLSKNISPITPSASKFTTTLMQLAGTMLIPLLVLIFAGDSFHLVNIKHWKLWLSTI